MRFVCASSVYKFHQISSIGGRWRPLVHVINFHKMGKHVALLKLSLPSGFVIFYIYNLDGTLVHWSTPVHNRRGFFLRRPEPDTALVIRHSTSDNKRSIVVDRSCSAGYLHKRLEPFRLIRRSSGTSWKALGGGRGRKPNNPIINPLENQKQHTTLYASGSKGGWIRGVRTKATAPRLRRSGCEAALRRRDRYVCECPEIKPARADGHPKTHISDLRGGRERNSTPPAGLKAC